MLQAGHHAARASATTLARERGVEDADADHLYAAMDRLSARQERIEDKLARRHPMAGGRCCMT